MTRARPSFLCSQWYPGWCSGSRVEESIWLKCRGNKSWTKGGGGAVYWDKETRVGSWETWYGVDTENGAWTECLEWETGMGWKVWHEQGKRLKRDRTGRGWRREAEGITLVVNRDPRVHSPLEPDSHYSSVSKYLWVTGKVYGLSPFSAYPHRGWQPITVISYAVRSSGSGLCCGSKGSNFADDPLGVNMIPHDRFLGFFSSLLF